MTPGAQRLRRKMAAMSLRGPLVAGRSLHFDERSVFTAGERVVRVSRTPRYQQRDAKQQQWLQARRQRRQQQRARQRFTRSREESLEVNHVCVKGHIEKMMIMRKIPKRSSYIFRNSIGCNKSCLLRCDSALLLLSFFTEITWNL